MDAQAVARGRVVQSDTVTVVGSDCAVDREVFS